MPKNATITTASKAAEIKPPTPADTEPPSFDDVAGTINKLNDAAKMALKAITLVMPNVGDHERHATLHRLERLIHDFCISVSTTLPTS